MEQAKGQRSTSDWLEKLRRQFERIASRRVDRDDVEDVVQDALHVVAEKGIDLTVEHGDLPRLAWCFQVLRNTIGNHYRRVKTRRQWVVSVEECAGDDGGFSQHALESYGSVETLMVIEASLVEMAKEHPQCERYLSRLVAGVRLRDIAKEEALAPAVFSRRLYRCRQKLRSLLAAKGVVL